MKQVITLKTDWTKGHVSPCTIINVYAYTTGYTRHVYGGHLTVPTDPSKDGYNGPDGYRRNTFDLRQKPSVFDYEGT